jgi:hypothetical protein
MRFYVKTSYVNYVSKKSLILIETSYRNEAFFLLQVKSARRLKLEINKRIGTKCSKERYKEHQSRKSSNAENRVFES